MSYYRDQLEGWLKEIEVKAGRVLDIGGAALPVYGRVKSWDVEAYEIFDKGTEPPKISDPGRLIFRGDIQNTDFKTYSLFQKNVGLPELPFDIVFCLEVAEYLYDPMSALKNISTYLMPGGVLYMSFPFVYPIHSPREYDCLRYTRHGILKLLGLAGFRVEYIMAREAHDPDKLIDFYKSDGMHIKEDSTITGYLIKAVKI